MRDVVFLWLMIIVCLLQMFAAMADKNGGLALAFGLIGWLLTDRLEARK